MRDVKTCAAMEQPKMRQQNAIPRTAVRILQRHYAQQKQERQTQHQRQPVEYATEQAQQGAADAARLIFRATRQLQRKYALHKYRAQKVRQRQEATAVQVQQRDMWRSTEQTAAAQHTVTVPRQPAQKPPAPTMTAAQQRAKQHTQRAAQRQMLQQAKAGLDIAKKSYERVQRLFDEGVMTAQKRDEAFANYKALEAQTKAAQSQYDMAVNGARQEEKKAAAAQVDRAKGAVEEVNSYINETMQIAQMEGEVSDIYPKTGELIGAGSPIMSISQLNDMWGTFNIREDQLEGMKNGSVFKAFLPAFNKEIRMKVYYIKDQGSYATWKATKSNGEYDLKTFEVKARPLDKIDGLRPGMSLIIKKK